MGGLGSIGVSLVPALPGGELGELQRRVLDSVARSVDRAPRTASRPCDPEQAECVADGLRVLLASLPTITGPRAATAAPAGLLDTGALLGQAGEVLDGVAEAARRAAIAFAVVGDEVAADIADSLMTVALALRMLVEIGRRTLRPR